MYIQNNCVTVDKHLYLITFDLDPVQAWLDPFDDELVAIDGAAEDEWRVGPARDHHLHLLGGGGDHVSRVQGLHGHVNH